MKIGDYYRYSWFSDLAYVDWRPAAVGPTGKSDHAIEDANAAKSIPGDPDHPGIDNLGDLIFMEPGDGGLGWQITAFHTNAETDSGFAGSLFENPNTHEKVLALRGTETGLLTGIDDLLAADYRDIVKLGIAVEQAVAMINWINRLAAPKDSDVRVLTLPRDLDLLTLSALPRSLAAPGLLALIGGLDRNTLPNAGLGLLRPTDHITVTGHSLGGHLANIAIRLFPTLLDQAVTFNAPGFDAATGLGLSEVFFAALRGNEVTPHVTDSFEGLTIHTLQAESSGPELLRGDADVIADLGILPTEPQEVLVEVSTHSMNELLDSLGVHALLEWTAGGELNLTASNTLLAAASNQEANSAEKLVDALSRLLLSKDIAPLAVGQGSYPFGSTEFPVRSALHARLLELQSFIAGHPGARLRSLVDITAPDLADLARQHGAPGLPYRYALQQGIPFAITGKDAAATAALYAPHNANHRLDLYDPANRTGLSDAYLEDRARMLAQSIQRNLIDSTLVTDGPYRNEEYDDLAQGVHFATADVAQFGTGRSPEARQYVFGTRDSDSLTGGKGSDHLYGMAGDDFVDGRGGDDYLEGGIGQDQYTSNSGSGFDRIFDSDGRGRIVVDGDLLTGGPQIGDHLWQSTDGRHAFALDGDRLYIDGRIRVEAFRSEALGIRLTPATPPTTSGHTELTDAHADKVLYWRDRGDHHYDPYRATGGSGNDLILTGLADDQLEGGKGNDWMLADGGDDHLGGGEGNDALFPGEGADIADGGPGNDVIDDARYLRFDSSGSETRDIQIWHDIGGRFGIEAVPSPRRDKDEEIGFSYGLTMPQQPFSGSNERQSFAYTPLGKTQGMVQYEDGRRYTLFPVPLPSSDDTPNRFSGGAGDDWLGGNAGNDILSGDDGNDLLLGRQGNDNLLGGAGEDLIAGQQDRDLLDGGQGNDRLYGGSGSDLIHGGDGDDLLVGDNDLAGQGEADVLLGEAGDDQLHGNGGDDRLYGGEGKDNLRGEDGADWLEGEAGDDRLHGGDDADLLFGGPGRDQLYGDQGDDRLHGGAGQDVLKGGDGDDLLDGGADGVSDRLFGGRGDDRFVFHARSGSDIVEDAAEDDQILLTGLSPDDITLETGIDTQGNPLLLLRVDDRNALIVKDGIERGAGSYRFANGELSRRQLLSRLATPLAYRLDAAGELSGGQAADRLSGSMGDDRLFGQGGDDILAGSGGDDYLAGGEGEDRYLVGPGTGGDRIDEGNGEISTLELLPGVGLEQLRYHRIGDDLQIAFSAGGDSVRLVGFFTRGQTWSLRDSAGQETVLTAADIVADLQPTATHLTLSERKDSFFRRIESAYGNVLRLHGYRQGPDGRWHGEFDRGYSVRERATHHLRYSVAFDPIRRHQPEGDYTRTERTLETHLVDEFQETRTTPIPDYAPGGKRVSTHGNSGRLVDLDALGHTGLSGAAFSGRAVPVHADHTEYNPLTGEMEAPLDGYLLYPNGAGSAGHRIERLTHTTSVLEARIKVLDLTLGDGNDRFRIQRGYSYPFNLVDGGAGDDLLDASTGDDRWSREPPTLSLPNSGSWALTRLPGSLLYGNLGDDRLIGSDGADELIGGPGNDDLQGGHGSDTYRVDLHGMDRIFEDGHISSGSDRLILPPGITPDSIRYQWGTTLAHNLDPADRWPGRMTSLHATVTLRWGPSDGVTLVLPHSDQNAGLGIDTVIFGDGQALPLSRLLEQSGIHIDQDPHLGDNDLRGNRFLHGYAGDDELTGVAEAYLDPSGQVHHRGALLIGGAGRDTLNGSEGPDLLIGADIEADYRFDFLTSVGTLSDEGNTFAGGPGTDIIWATSGNDLFLFAPGDGRDIIRDQLHMDRSGAAFSLGRRGGALRTGAIADPLYATEGEDRLRFGGGIEPEDIQVMRTHRRGPGGDALVFAHRNGEDSITFEHWFDAGRNQLSRVEFDDGYFWDRTDLEALWQGRPANQAPLARGEIGELAAAPAGRPLEITLPELFSDPEGSAIAYSLEQSADPALPDWLSFDAISRTLRGTPPLDAVGGLDLKLVAHDDRGKIGRLGFQLEIVSPPEDGQALPSDGSDRAEVTPGATGESGLDPIDSGTAASDTASPPPSAPAGLSPNDGAAMSPTERHEGPTPLPLSEADASLQAGVSLVPTPPPSAAPDHADPRAAPTPLAKNGLEDPAPWSSDQAWPTESIARREPVLVATETSRPHRPVTGPSLSSRWLQLQRALKSLDDQWQSAEEQDRTVPLGAGSEALTPLPTTSGTTLAARPGGAIGLLASSLPPFQGLTEGFRPHTL
ncbi:MAG: hypothetical protein D6720_10615 [Gammaproteobacteria bacterium]|nr:MAG: hypothetical protein D6720_10615 [Gammaproteobacteria bacterium]